MPIINSREEEEEEEEAVMDVKTKTQPQLAILQPALHQV
jgi:hypothetical protein